MSTTNRKLGGVLVGIGGLGALWALVCCVARWFCAEPNCPIVYYGDKGACFTVDDLREPVAAKIKGDARPICYCFGFSEGDARKEIERTGQSTIPATVSGLIKAGVCACEVRNPAGVCCLGEVNQTVNRLSAEHNESR